MTDAARRAVRPSTLALAAAALSYAASYVHPPTVEVAAAFAILAVVALAAQHILAPTDALAGSWLAAAAAAALVVATDTAPESRFAALSLAALAVVGYVAFPLTARVVDGDAGDRLF